MLKTYNKNYNIHVIEVKKLTLVGKPSRADHFAFRQTPDQHHQCPFLQHRPERQTLCRSFAAGRCVNPRWSKYCQGVSLAECKIQTYRAYCRLESVRVRDEQAEYYRRKMFFMGSSEKVLALIKQRVKVDYPNIEVETYSPPYKPEFSEEDNRAIVEAINKANPDLLWIGMTAPKQEKWAYTHWHELEIHCHCGTIGAVFDFYAGTVKRAPAWWQRHSLEWCYRLLKEPRRMWKRYIIGNLLFMWNICKE